MLDRLMLHHCFITPGETLHLGSSRNRYPALLQLLNLQSGGLKGHDDNACKGKNCPCC